MTGSGNFLPQVGCSKESVSMSALSALMWNNPALLNSSQINKIVANLGGCGYLRIFFYLSVAKQHRFDLAAEKLTN